MDSNRTSMIVRMFVVYGFMMLLPCAIIFQIIRIQFFEGENLRALWQAQAVEQIPISAQRGKIFDSQGRLMVTNAVSYSVAVDPHAPGAKADQMKQVTEVLSHFQRNGSAQYRRIISQASKGSRYIVLDRNVSRDVYDSLSALKIKGVILEENFRRRYNFGSLAAHVLGHVNSEFTGVMGVESSYNKFLKGIDGVQQVRRDNRNRIKEFVGAPRKQPVQGNNVFTTIDAHIQAIVEEELRDGTTLSRAKKGVAIVVNPKTGAIVAMANYPDFNPNAPAASETQLRRNSAIADIIEPGSTFKLITAAAAIDQNVIAEGEIFETPDNGRKLIHGQWMRDHDPLGNMTFAQVIQRSSNVATSEIAMRMNPDTFYQYVRNSGFGTSSSIDLPGEETGRLRKPYEWSSVTLPWMSIGYEIQVTPLQMAMAYAAFANNGNLMRPYIVDRIEDERGRIIHQNKPKTVRRTFSPEVIKTMMPVFAGVVSDSGTAQYASVDGLSIAGKTGTAQKYIDGKYQTRYRASFVGFYPTEDPKYVAFILLDEPRSSIYGGFVAGPIFRNIAQRIVGLDPDILQNTKQESEPALAHVPSLTGFSLDDASSLLQFKEINHTISGNGKIVVDQEPEAGTVLEKDMIVRLFTTVLEQAENEPARIPDVHGMSMRDAVVSLKNAGYEVSRNGSGTVAAQFPKAGEIMSPGRTVTIRGRSRSMEQLLAKGGMR